MSRLLQTYLALLESKPILTKSLSSGVLLGTGDVISQYIEHFEKNKENKEAGIETKSVPNFDTKRIIKMTSFGVFLGPVLHLWYLTLDKLVKTPPLDTLPFKQKIITGSKKVLIDQLTFAPFSIPMFFTYMGIYEGRSWKYTKEKISEKFWSTLVANYYIWPAAQIVNFSFVPPQQRVLFANMVSIAWNAILSHIQHTPLKNEKQ